MSMETRRVTVSMPSLKVKVALSGRTAPSGRASKVPAGALKVQATLSVAAATPGTVSGTSKRVASASALNTSAKAGSRISTSVMATAMVVPRSTSVTVKVPPVSMASSPSTRSISRMA